MSAVAEYNAAAWLENATLSMERNILAGNTALPPTWEQVDFSRFTESSPELRATILRLIETNKDTPEAIHAFGRCPE